MKKVLIICYYWPPSGGGGVQRWLKFTKYLPGNGWTPIVVVPENPEYAVQDATLAKDIPTEAEVIKLPIWEPYGVFKKITKKGKKEKVNAGLLSDKKRQSFLEKVSMWIRGNILIPDPRVFWVNPTARKLKKLIPTINPDAIITTGPPHSIHLIGLRLKKQFPEIKWISDFRDPWSEIDYLDTFYASSLARRWQKKLEQKVLDRSDKVITVSPSWVKDLQKNTKTPVKCITNGFDYEDFPEVANLAASEKFTISHVGIINSFRQPEALWKALEELCSEDKEFSEKLEVELIGTIDKSLKVTLTKYPQLNAKTTIVGYIPHSEVTKRYSQSACLLLLLNNSKNSQGHIPGKFFEYIASRKPVLAMAPENSDVAGIIQENKIGFACDFEDKEKAKDAILSIFKNLGNPTSCMSVDNYSRKSLSKQLASLLD